MTLQEQFLQSKGKPISIHGHQVIQGDRIPIKSGTVRVEFIGKISGTGIALKSKKGGIELSDGRLVPLLHIWDERGLPRYAEHKVNCPDGELRVWNVYKTRHPDGSITTDSWTGNAGLVVEEISATCRRYHCSKGAGDFDPNETTVEISWAR